MRWRPGGDEADLPESRQFEHFLGKTQVPEVDRVERPAQYTHGDAGRWITR